METQEAQTQETPAAAPKAAAVKLTLKADGKEYPLLKYPFPVKAARFPVTVNGATVDAATTAGRGKAYTYLLINNASFYVAGTIPKDASCEVNFPENYKFDEKQAPRVSNYKPKKAAKPVGEAQAADPNAGKGNETEQPDTAEAETATTESDVQPDAPKSARRGKK